MAPQNGETQPVQLHLDFDEQYLPVHHPGGAFNDPAFASNKTQPVHRWVPWIAGFSKEFVVGALERYANQRGATIMDPFAGVGTTLLEGLFKGHSVIGFEINPYPFLSMKTKLSLPHLSPARLEEEISAFARQYQNSLQSNRPPKSAMPAGFQTRIPFFSPAVLTKVLTVLDYIHEMPDPVLRDVFRIAFASTLVSYSNYSYEPSLGTRLGSGKSNIEDAPVGEIIEHKLKTILTDVRWFWTNYPNGFAGTHQIFNDSCFNASDYVHAEQVDLILTSPPYLNNYHYNRNTRPHLYWLGFADHPGDLKPLEMANFGTYWQIMRDRETAHLAFTLVDSDLEATLEQVRSTNPDKGLYGGVGWANYATQYFNDCLRFAQQAHAVLKPGGVALVVIGNSILQGTMIATDRYLAEIAALAGLDVIGIDIPRTTRVGNSIVQSAVRAGKTNAKHQLYEAVVTLRKP
jgi:DNA modification methylase